jgi:putative ATP-binding cassette transporter
MQNKFFKFITFSLGYSRTLILLSTFAGIVAGVSGAILMALINARVAGTASGFNPSVGAFVGFATIALVSTATSGFLCTYLTQRIGYDLRLQICRKLLATPLRLTEEIGAHNILAALTQDVSNIISAIVRVPGFCINAAVVFSGFVYLGILSPPMLLVLVVFIVIAIATYVVPQRYAWRNMCAARDEYSTLVSHFRSLISGAKELKLHRARRMDFLLDVLETSVVSLRRYSFVSESIYVMLSSWRQVLFFVFIGLIIFGMPGVTGQVDLRVLTGYTLTALYIWGPLQSLVGTFPSFTQANISLNQLEKLGLSLSATDTTEATAQSGVQPAWQKLELSGVTHTYYQEREAGNFMLGPIDLTLKPGELIFVTGSNGSGKTTFAKLLCGLYAPESGEIRLDGVPITAENRDDFRQHFSVLFAEFHLFEQLLGLKNPGLDDMVRDYLIRLQLEHKVEVKEGKLSTTELSYGQRKRLGLLISYLEDRPIYIFDEWAADQDPYFREIFYRKMLPELKARGKTVIVISHDDRYYDVAERRIKLEFGKLEYDETIYESVHGGGAKYDHADSYSGASD